MNMTTKSSDFELHELTDAVPDGLADPLTYQVFVMPVTPEQVTAGGIIIPTQTQEAAEWHHAIGRIAKIGPCAFKHPRFADMGFTDDHKANVGDLVIYSARTPIRFRFGDTRILVINDDWIYGRIQDEATAAKYKFI